MMVFGLEVFGKIDLGPRAPGEKCEPFGFLDMFQFPRDGGIDDELGFGNGLPKDFLDPRYGIVLVSSCLG